MHDDAVGDGQRIRRNGELGRGEIDQHAAHLGAGQAQRRAAVLDRLAAGGLPFVGRHARYRPKRSAPATAADRVLRPRSARARSGCPARVRPCRCRRWRCRRRRSGSRHRAMRLLLRLPGSRAAAAPWASSSAGSSEKASTRPPSALGEAAAREGRSVHGQVLPICFAGAHDGGDDPIVGSAAAEMTGQRLAHVGIGRLRLLIQQFLGLHDHAVDAIAALRGLLVDEGLLQRMRLFDACRAPRWS